MPDEELSPKPYLKLQGGETLFDVSETNLSQVLKNLHSEHQARVTAYSNQASLSVFGSVSQGFAISYKATEVSDLVCSTRMLSYEETLALLSAFVRDDTKWKDNLVWRREKPWVNIVICILAVFAILSVIFFFLKDLMSWL